MLVRRDLPSRGNPHLLAPEQPAYATLIGRRRLGRAYLNVDSGQIDTHNATDLENRRRFDYVHLRAPLPAAEDLRGSGVFYSNATQLPPVWYYLMRRSSDGFVSATGMFKAAFPWATKTEEEQERNYILSLDSTDQEEIAGNVWCPPGIALQLAREYRIYDWVRALLDPTPVAPKSPSRAHKSISLPPAIIMASGKSKSSETSTPATSTQSARKGATGRGTRSVSPTKVDQPTPSRPKASPRKRNRKPSKTGAEESVKSAAKALRDATESTPLMESAAEEDDFEKAADAIEEIAQSVKDTEAIQDTISGKTETDEPLTEGGGRVTVTTDVVEEGDVETTRTSVKVELPADSPEQPLPKSPDEALKQAKTIVAEAKALQSSAPVSKKRKAADLEIENEEEEIVHEVPQEATVNGTKAVNGVAATSKTSPSQPPAKRARVMVPAEEFRRQKMQKRALVGLSATIAVGAIIPFVSNLF